MRVPLTYIIILWVGLGVSYTQPNLILNPSVEDIDSCYDIGFNNYKYIQNWSNPCKSSPDYFNTCHTNPFTGIPFNSGLGYQYSNTGNAHLGLLFTNILGIYRESLQGKFSEPLQKDRKYCFEFYTVKANFDAYATKELGVYLSKDSLFFNDVNCLSIGNYTSIDIQYFNDTLNWTKFSVEINNYEDDIQYFVFSNFQNGTDFQLKLVDTNGTDSNIKSTYYYFDDFTLYDCGEADSLPDTVDTASVNFPSVFTPNGDGINDVLHMEGLPPGSNLEVYNRWGEIVHKAYPYTIPWDGNKNGHPCPEGVYHYIVQLPDGQTVRKFVHVFR